MRSKARVFQNRISHMFGWKFYWEPGHILFFYIIIFDLQKKIEKNFKKNYTT